MGNNMKSEQNDFCLAFINPRLCKGSSVEIAIEQHDTETTIPFEKSDKIQYDKNGFPVMPDYAML